MADEGGGGALRDFFFMAFYYCKNLNYVRSNCITYLNQSFIKLIITLWWKPRRVFLSFHFVGEKPCGGFPLRVFFILL